MNRRRNKHRLRAHLVFVYALMATAVIATVAVLILIVQGYRYNQYHGKVEQGGLVQFDSRPSGASVTVDGVGLANRTASKITLGAGEHTIMMSRDGYGSWSHTATVKPGSVLWLNYTLLFPNKPTLSSAATFGAIMSALPAPDYKRVAVISGNEFSITTLDTANPETRRFAISPESYTAPAEDEATSFTALSWDKDSKFLLVRYTHGSSHEYLSVNTHDGTARNITKGLGVDVAELAYSLADANTVYLVTTSRELRRSSLSEMTMSGPIASNVSNLSVTEKNLVLFSTYPDEKGTRTIAYVSSGSIKPKIIKSYEHMPADQILTAASGPYFGDHYFALAANETIMLYKNPLPSSDSRDEIKFDQSATMPIKGGAAMIGFSGETNRIFYAQHGASLTTYDMELNRTSEITLPEAPSRRIEWIDRYHFATTLGGVASYSDFDGTNGVSVATNAADLPVMLSDDNKHIYYFVTSGDETTLMRAKLTR